jgi:hypothetical protein
MDEKERKGWGRMAFKRGAKVKLFGKEPSRGRRVNNNGKRKSQAGE